MLAARGAPQLEASEPPQDEQRLTDSPGGSMDEHALAWLHARRAVQELVRGHPTQDERRRFRLVDVWRHSREVVSTERSIGCVRPEHRHVGDAIADLEVAHTIADLIDFPDDVIPHHERRPVARSLWIQMAPDQDVGVLQAGGQYVDPYLAAA